MNGSANTASPNSAVRSPRAIPAVEVRLASHAKETLRGLYGIDSAQLTDAYLRELADDLTDSGCPPELSRMGRTLRRWHHQIINWHHARVTNGPTEAVII